MTAPKSKIRVVMPDSHGNHIDPDAKAAFLRDVKSLDPDEIVGLGDHLDCGGTFNTHQRNYTKEFCESYEEDVDAANDLFDQLQKNAPRARIYYIEGNHEAHVERWASRTFASHKDAVGLLEKYGPEAVLKLKSRGISYHKRSEFYQGLSIPGTIKIGRCFFTHGISFAKNAAQVHLQRFGAPVVFGHVHRSQSVVERSVVSDGYGAWCPGTLARLQALYLHTAPSSWSHGFGLQFVNASGQFLHVQVPIHKGRSLLMDVARRLA